MIIVIDCLKAGGCSLKVSLFSTFQKKPTQGFGTICEFVIVKIYVLPENITFISGTAMPKVIYFEKLNGNLR